MSPILIGQTDYTYAGSPGNVKILKVTTVDETGLTAIFGATWSDTLQAAFGPGCNVTDARSKSVVTAVDSTLTQDYGLGQMDVVNITVDYWLWTTEAFNDSEPDFDELSLYFLKHPENLTALVNFYTNFYSGTTYDVTVPFSLGFLVQLPTEGSSFLSELDWEDNWTPSGFTITHEATTGYIIYGFVWGFGFYPIGSMLQDCTEIWTYDSTYGAFIGYELKDDADTTVYKFEIELAATDEIPDYELLSILGMIGITSLTLIYVVMKKKRSYLIYHIFFCFYYS